MFELNGEKFHDQTLLPPTPEFPEGFGKRLLPESGKPIELEILIAKNLNNIIQATRQWGALIIPKVLIEPEYYWDGGFGTERDKTWITVPNYQLQWSWHSDLTPSAIILVHLDGKPPRKLGTGVAPTSIIDKGIQEQARLEIAKNPRGTHINFFQQLASKDDQYRAGNRIKMIDQEVWPRSQDYLLEGQIRNFYRELNYRLINEGRIVSHQWAAYPGSAMLLYNENPVEPPQISTTVHACLMENGNNDPGGVIWKKEINGQIPR